MVLSKTWHAAVTALLALPPHTRLRLATGEVDQPRDAGFYRSVGLARAKAHYRHALPNGRGIHVHEHDGHFLVHWDRVDPSHGLLKHFRHDVLAVTKRTLHGGRPQIIASSA